MLWPATKSCRPAVRRADATGSATSPRSIFRSTPPRRRDAGGPLRTRRPARRQHRLHPNRRRFDVRCSRRHGRGVRRASDRRAEALSAARGRALDTRDDKFASLALAFQHGGVFVDVPPGVASRSRSCSPTRRASRPSSRTRSYASARERPRRSSSACERAQARRRTRRFSVRSANSSSRRAARSTYVVLQEAAPMPPSSRRGAASSSAAAHSPSPSPTSAVD